MNDQQIAKLRTAFGRDPNTGGTNNNTGANNNTEKVVNVNYGHHGSGKTYSYRDPNGTHRAGDNVVVPVKHTGSGKEYNTLATIRSTHGGNTGAAMDTRNNLSNNNKRLKAVTNERQSELPGYYAGWGNDAAEIAQQRQMVIEMQNPGNDTQKDMAARNDLFRMLRNLRKRQIKNGGNV
jgi:hypothetical protein